MFDKEALIDSGIGGWTTVRFIEASRIDVGGIILPNGGISRIVIGKRSVRVPVPKQHLVV
jgi:hypothetical protein